MSRHAAENSVSERRLRPIYDWLDNGNNKKALQEADKVLKKQPDFQCCKVLKCLALIRLGKEGEAEGILNKVLAENPVDEGALQAMTIAWRELQQPAKICSMYEGAVKKEPQNEEFLTHLFMSYVRLGEFKKQQLAAMNLYKVVSKNPYYFWSVMSLVLQAVDSDPKLAKTVHLPLAHKMVEKMEANGKLEQEQEVLLYILILELKEDWRGGLSVLDGPLGKKLVNSASYKNFCLTKRVEFHVASGDWEEVAKLSTDELDRLPDQWKAYTQLITAVKELNSRENTTFNIQEAENYILSQQNKYPDIRGPWLAQLELVSEMKDASLLPPLIIAYFEKFGSKPVAFSDLSKYLSKLSPTQRLELVDSLTNKFSDMKIDNIGDICRDVNLNQISRFCGKMSKSNNVQLEEEARRLVNKHKSVQHIVGNMVPTDLRPSDNYLVLASHFLWDLWTSTKDATYFVQCTSVLFTGLTTSPSNWQMKLMLIRAMNIVGAGAVSYNLHSSLDIKHLMLDTLGWLLGRHLSLCGQLGLASQHANQSVKLYNHVNKDTADHIITAFRSGTFYQIRDIYKLRNRLATSHNYLSMDTERQLLDVLIETSTHSQAVQMMSYLDLTDEDKDSQNWDKKKDNRDLTTMVSWAPPEDNVDKNLVEESFLHELLFSRTRQLLLRTIASAVFLSEDMISVKESIVCSENGVPSSKCLATNMLKFTTALRSHWENSCSVVAGVKPANKPLPHNAPSWPSTADYASSGQIAVVLGLLEVASDIYAESDIKSIQEKMRAAIKHIENGLNHLESRIDSMSTQLLERGYIFEQIVWILEAIGLCAVLVGVILSLLRGSSGDSSKGGKKGKKGKYPIQHKFSGLSESYSFLLDKMVEAAKRLSCNVEKWESDLLTDELSKSISHLTVEEDDTLKEANEVMKKMEKSYKDSFHQIKACLKNKTSYLIDLRL